LLSEELSVRLLQDYDAVRQREVELVTHLMDILPRIDNLDQQWLNQLRDAMFHADHPYMMVFVGPFNSGKSSLINALVGRENLLKIGPTPVTDKVSILRYGEDVQPIEAMNRVQTVFYPAPLLKKVSLVDTPGLDSVFHEHEETTQKFLHRADIILLVMLATQVMTSSNLEYLKRFKQYGQKVILVVNQIDLLTEEEQQKVKQYVSDHSKDRLGFAPEVWMVSAKWGLEAQAQTPRDEALWERSNLGVFEAFVERQLNDANRLRQKLQTPLQIAKNAHQAAVETVKTNQERYDSYRLIGENIERQLEQQKNDQLRMIRETNAEIEARFKETSKRARRALNDLFRLSAVLEFLGRGLLEATFVGRVLRGGKPSRRVHEAFQRHRVYEPLNELKVVSDRLPARLEGQDMKDMQDLAAYAQREVMRMPQDMQDKLIGTIQVPMSYDRTPTLRMREELEPLEQEAIVTLTDAVEQRHRAAMIYLVLWQLICAVLLVALIVLWGQIAATNEAPIEFVLLASLIIVSLIGFVTVPLRGRWIHHWYHQELLGIQARYIEAITKAADAQLATSMQLRQSTVRPLTQLIEAQASVQGKQLTQLQQAEQSVLKLDADVNALGKRRLLGLTL
jgi:small GTP-binding protein